MLGEHRVTGGFPQSFPKFWFYFCPTTFCFIFGSCGQIIGSWVVGALKWQAWTPIRRLARSSRQQGGSWKASFKLCPWFSLPLAIANTPFFGLLLLSVKHFPRRNFWGDAGILWSVRPPPGHLIPPEDLELGVSDVRGEAGWKATCSGGDPRRQQWRIRGGILPAPKPPI